jgi:hypothetical protein
LIREGIGHPMMHDNRLWVHHGHIVDDELIGRLLVAPSSHHLLIEHRIRHDMDSPYHWVIGVICY